MSIIPIEQGLSDVALQAVANHPEFGLTAYGVFTVTEKSIQYMEQGWTKDEMARNSFGHPTLYSLSTACCWCASSAVMRSFLDLEIKGDISRTQEFVRIWWDVNPDVIKKADIPQAIKNRLDDGTGNAMVYYNDAPEVTLDEVLETFRNLLRRPHEK